MPGSVRALTVTKLQTRGDNAVVARWATITGNGDTGAPFTSPGLGERSVQFTGDFQATTMVLEGSNDGVNYVTLKDIFGNAISLTDVGIRQVAEITAYMRPSSGGGDLNQAVVTTLLAWGS